MTWDFMDPIRFQLLTWMLLPMEESSWEIITSILFALQAGQLWWPGFILFTQVKTFLISNSRKLTTLSTRKNSALVIIKQIILTRDLQYMNYSWRLLILNMHRNAKWSSSWRSSIWSATVQQTDAGIFKRSRIPITDCGKMALGQSQSWIYSNQKGIFITHRLLDGAHRLLRSHCTRTLSASCKKICPLQVVINRAFVTRNALLSGCFNFTVKYY